MAEYVYIQDYSKRGKLGISKKCIEEIISISTNKILGVETADSQNKKFAFSFYKPISCEIVNGKVQINVQVKIKQGHNIETICTNIQEQIAEDITSMSELVPFSIKIKVVSII
jgi:uncharacterized alkaline shock family protein YloU